MNVNIARRSLPKSGETANGDRAFWRQEGGLHLVAVVDGLGHGPEADAASQSAVACLEGVLLNATLSSIMADMHRALAGSRGVAATVCLFRSGTVEACAVGNVELRCNGLQLPLVYSPGILGSRVSQFRVCQAPLGGLARLVLFSDGISSSAHLDELRHLDPDAACTKIMNTYRRNEDDSTVLVADVELDK